MKIAVLLESTVFVGGGFNQALNSILQIDKLKPENTELLILTRHKENISVLKKFDIKVENFKYSLWDKIFTLLSTSLWWLPIVSRLKLVSSFEKQLKIRNVDIVYYLNPTINVATLQTINYIFTVWDICHRDMPEFPEVRSVGIFHNREHLYKTYLSAALCVLTDSEALSDRIKNYYCVDPSRLLAMPFSPTPFLQKEAANIDVIKKYNLKKSFFYYPAQFWPHKNHIRILEALCLLKKEGIIVNVVFSGSNFDGHQDYVENFIKQYDLQEQVSILGFLPGEDIPALYDACFAVIMPTYFGPTNLPPMEAWASKKPLIYSSILAEHVGDAALLTSPDSAEECAEAIKQLQDENIYRKLVENGTARLKRIQDKRDAAEAKLRNILRTFALRRKCWKA